MPIPGVIASAYTVPAAGSSLTVTYVTSGGGSYGSNSNQPPLTLPSWAVTSGDLLIVAVGACGASNAPGTTNWSLTGGGLTWTKQVEANTNAIFLANCAIFTAPATSTTTITNLVATHSSGLQVMYATWSARSQHATTPVPATAQRADSSTDGQQDITLSATPASTSVLLAVCYMNADDNNATKKIDHGAGDGWTEDFDFSPSMSSTNQWGQWEGQRKTSPTLTRVRWDDIKPATVTATTYSFSACAVEVKAA